MSRSTAEPLRESHTEPGHRVFTGRLFRVRRGRAKVFTQIAPTPSEPQPTRPLRAARMLALAHAPTGMSRSLLK